MKSHIADYSSRPCRSKCSGWRKWNLQSDWLWNGKGCSRTKYLWKEDKGLYHVGNWPTVSDCHAILCRYWRKLRKVLLIMSLLSKFHALRVAPKTIAHEVKAVCVKLIKHLIVQKKPYETILPVTKTWDYIIYLRCLWFSECGNIKTSFAKHFHLNIKEDY